MEKMSKAEYMAFLTTPARCGKLATVRADSRPHVVPVWFALDGEDLIFTAARTSIKVKNIQRDPHVAMCIDEDHAPFHYVVIEGVAKVETTSIEGCRQWATIISRRYMGEDRAEEFGRRYALEGEWVFRIVAEHVIAYKNVVTE
jgi:PPOX class probable F420-dependent enzyme